MLLVRYPLDFRNHVMVAEIFTYRNLVGAIPLDFAFASCREDLVGSLPFKFLFGLCGQLKALSLRSFSPLLASLIYTNLSHRSTTNTCQNRRSVGSTVLYPTNSRGNTEWSINYLHPVSLPEHRTAAFSFPQHRSTSNYRSIKPLR